ncbi:MAG: LysM peptidoglycan-binding domain-containing protein [Acidobacteria bacterium]|nr:LysM peptidoglycan-binding domain-containing protein [Acidobacteriota bacterium]
MARLYLLPALLWCSLAARAAEAQVPKVPDGLISSQAASLVVGQKNFSDITPGMDDRRWGAISGIAIAGNTLIVVDGSYLAPPNNNRVLIYNDLNALRNRKPQDDLPNASVILGQPGPGETTPGTSATRMFQPSGVATAGTRLFISEWGNNRILIYNQIPQTDGAAADLVIGQDNFTSSGFGSSAKSLRRPNGVATDGTRLFIADSLNNRVLIYNNIPTQNGASANVVLGQPNFDTFERRPAAATTMFDPMSATTDGQRLIVTDLANNRVLIYNRIPTQNGAAADVVVGQPDFASSSPGNTATSLNFPRYAFSDGTRLVIVDSGNNRVLIYNQIPATNGAAADIVLGQEDFGGLLESCAASNFAVPFMAVSDGDMLYVSDGFNRRILGFRPGQNLITAVVNGASFSTAPQTAACDVILLQPPIAPGGMASIFGSNLADVTQPADSLPLLTEMGGVRVWLNEIPAPLYYVSPTQINVQVPFELKGYSASMEIERITASGSFRSAAVPVGVANGAPGVFTWDGTGTGPGIITHADFTPVNDASPAAPGETLVAFVTGLGTIDQPITTGGAAEFASVGSVTFAGVPGAGRTVTIFLNGLPYSYTTVEGNTLADVVTNLATLIEQSAPDITAQPDTENSAVKLSARTIGDQGTSNTYSAAISEGQLLTATLGGSNRVPGTITFVGTPQPGQTILVLLLNTPFEYTTVAGDTSTSVITKLAALIDSDPNVSAAADLKNLSIELSLKDPGAALSITYSVSVSVPGASITATPTGSTTFVPGDIAIGGVAGPGQIVSVFLAGTRYSYTTTIADTLDSVVSGLANLINADQNVSATADVTGLTIQLALKTPNLTINFSTSVALADALQADTGGAGAVPATVTIRGSPRTGQIVTVFLSGTRYAYTVRDGDTPASIAAALAPLLNGDPDVTAKVDGAAIQLERASDVDALRLDTGGASAVPATLTVRGTPRAGQIVTVLLGGTRYAYTVKSGDTPASIAAALTPLLDGHASVSATVDGAAITLKLETSTASASLSVEVSLPLSAVVTAPPGLTATTSFQHFTPGLGNASNTVSAFLGETLPAVPGDVLFFEAPDAGRIVTITLADTTYSYTIAPGDTLASLVTNLAALVNSDPKVSATADTNASRIVLALRDTASEEKIGFKVSVEPSTGNLIAIARSTTTTDSLAALVQFAGPVKGTAGLYQINFTVPSAATTNSVTKISFSQNLIVFGSVTDINIFSNRVTFPVVKP